MIIRLNRVECCGLKERRERERDPNRIEIASNCRSNKHAALGPGARGSPRRISTKTRVPRFPVPVNGAELDETLPVDFLDVLIARADAASSGEQAGLKHATD